jgi:hypothetical protein
VQTLRDIAPFVAWGAAAGLILALALLIVVWVRLRRLRRAQRTVLGAYGERDLVQHAQGLDEQVRNLRTAVEHLDARLDRHKSELDEALTSRAVVRYDAFRDIGGEQSASMALLDRHRSGLVVSSIHSRDYARLYVKQLVEGVPDRALSPEEVDVVEAATGIRPPEAVQATPQGKPATRPAASQTAAVDETPAANEPATDTEAPATPDEPED